MESYDYCIIGGGPGGIGFLDRIIEEGNKTAVLIEGRNELLYTLSFMPTVKISSRMFQKEQTGTEFRDFMLKENTRNSMVKLGSRLIAVDAENSRCTVNIKGEKNIVIRYKYLIIATGAIQSIYGRELLPGYRGAGVFTAYQISEMLTRYDFIPGRKLAVVGDTQYALETARIAAKEGIEVSLFSKTALGDNTIRYKAIKSLYGGEHISGIEIIDETGKPVKYAIDSIAVDGDFSMEHKMRELTGIEWDIEKWQADTGDKQQSKTCPGMFVIGDAFKPRFSFLEQYEKGYDLAGRII